MDYRLNNEALISCCISSLIKTRPLSVAQLSIIIPILLEDKIRQLIVANPRIKMSDKGIRKIGMAYHEYLPYVMNSLVLLIQGGCAEMDGDSIKSLPNNDNLIFSMQNGKSERLNNILRDKGPILTYICEVDIKSVFIDLKISL